MSYYYVEPEVAGGWGPNTVATRSAGRPTTVTRLHYVFDGWLGDELLESTPCFIATETLARALTDAQLTGFQLGEVEVSRSDQFLELCSDKDLPRFVWLKIEGSPGSDDLGLSDDMRLVASQAAMDVLQAAVIDQAIVTPA
jgi:hypothetical protein